MRLAEVVWLSALGSVACGGRSVYTLPSADEAAGGAGRGIVAAGGLGEAAGATANGAESSNGGASAVASPWDTLSHTPAPLPQDGTTWPGSVPVYSSVWSDSATRAWVTSALSNYEAPPSHALFRWEMGNLTSEDTGFCHTMGMLSGRSATDLWLAGCDAGILHDNGTGWVALGGPHGDSIWENSSSDVWTCCSPTATASLYALSHWDGTTWSMLPLPDDQTRAGALWSRGAGEVWVAGGVVRHWDGKAWLTVELDPAVNWAGVWGDGSGDVWVVGSNGAVARGGMATWSELPTLGVLAAPVALNAIWGSSRDDLWIVGDGGTILHWDGSRFALEPTGLTAALTAVWGVDGAVWVVGEEATLLRRPR